MRWQSPLALLVRELRRTSSTRAHWVALVPVLVVTLLIAAIPFSPALQQRMMARFHLASPSFVSWAILQPVPSMYNFANEVWLSDCALSEANLRKYPQLAHKAWCNHFPMQWMTCQHRQVAPVAPYRQFLHASSSYRGNRFFSRVELTKLQPADEVAFVYEEARR